MGLVCDNIANSATARYKRCEKVGHIGCWLGLEMFVNSHPWVF